MSTSARQQVLILGGGLGGGLGRLYAALGLVKTLARDSNVQITSSGVGQNWPMSVK